MPLHTDRKFKSRYKELQCGWPKWGPDRERPLETDIDSDFWRKETSWQCEPRDKLKERIIQTHTHTHSRQTLGHHKAVVQAFLVHSNCCGQELKTTQSHSSDCSFIWSRTVQTKCKMMLISTRWGNKSRRTLSELVIKKKKKKPQEDAGWATTSKSLSKSKNVTELHSVLLLLSPHLHGQKYVDTRTVHPCSWLQNYW